MTIMDIPATILPMRKVNPLRSRFSSLLIFIIIIHITRNIVEPINETPPIPETKLIPGLSKIKTDRINDETKTGIDHNRNL
jgi:hypothetical protein